MRTIWGVGGLLLCACGRIGFVSDACQLTIDAQAICIDPLGGSGGGSAQPDAMCADGELPIGFAFDMSEAGEGTEQVVVNFHIRCGQITRDAIGHPATTPMELVDVVGAECGNGWTAEPGSELRCPDGQVIVGLTANEANISLYNTVAMQCQGLGSNELAGTITTVAFPNTYNYANQPEIAMCPAGDAIVSFAITSGCGQDKTTPACAPATCM